MEPSGIITIIKKASYENVTRGDLQITAPSSSLNLSVILDGKPDLNNLMLLGFSEDWLKKMLLDQNVLSYNDVMYAEWNTLEGLYLQKRNDTLPNSVK